MNNQHFDNYFHNTLAQHETTVPADMWNKISEQKRKRRGFLFWLKILGNVGAVSLFIFALGYGWYVQPNNANNIAEKSKAIKNKLLADDKVGDNSTQNILLENNQLATNATKAIEPAIQLLATNTFKSNATKLKQPKAGLNAGFVIAKNSTLTVGITSVNDKKDSHTAIDSTYPFNNNTTYGKWVNIEQVNTKNKSGYNNLECILETFNSASSPIIECPSVLNRPKRQLNVEAWLSPDFALNATHTNSSNIAYMQKKDSAEKSSLSYSVGFRISKEIARNIFAKIGFQYTQVDKKFSYKLENERRTVQVITIRNIVRGPGDTLRISDTSLFTQIGYLEKNSINHYRTIDIPVLVSYNFQNNGWHFGATAGAIFNIHSWYKGETFDSAFNPINIGKESGFKNNIGIGFYGSFHIAKDIGNKVSLYAEPYGRYNLSSLTNNQSLYNEKYHIIGLQLGIKYKIY